MPLTREERNKRNRDRMRAKYQEDPEAGRKKVYDIRAANRKGYLNASRARLKSIRDAVDKLKSKPCTDCGGTFPVVCMDFDHVRGEKEFNISRGISYGYKLERILAEIEKCELVCSNCHRVRTHK